MSYRRPSLHHGARWLDASTHRHCAVQALLSHKMTMDVDEHIFHKTELIDGVKKSRLVTLVLHNNSATTTQCPDDYKPKPEDIPYPRPNNLFEEALAVSAMFLAFTLGVLLPFILMGCIPAVIFYRSKLAAALLVMTTVDCLLPAGKVRNACYLQHAFKQSLIDKLVSVFVSVYWHAERCVASGILVFL